MALLLALRSFVFPGELLPPVSQAIQGLPGLPVEGLYILLLRAHTSPLSCRSIVAGLASGTTLQAPTSSRATFFDVLEQHRRLLHVLPGEVLMQLPHTLVVTAPSRPVLSPAFLTNLSVGNSLELLQLIGVFGFPGSLLDNGVQLSLHGLYV